MVFKNEQIEFMKKIGLTINFSKPLSDLDYEIIEQKVSMFLQKYGFDDDYEPTEEGKICEAILDCIAE